MKPLYKTTLIIWSEFPGGADEADLAEFADAVVTYEDAFCSKQESILVNDPKEDPDWVKTDIFGD